MSSYLFKTKSHQYAFISSQLAGLSNIFLIFSLSNQPSIVNNIFIISDLSYLHNKSHINCLQLYLSSNYCYFIRFNFWFLFIWRQTGVIYFQLHQFQYKNTRKLILNSRIECAYFYFKFYLIENKPPFWLLLQNQ